MKVLKGMFFLMLVTLIIASSTYASVLVGVAPKIIYGNDDRLDLYQVADPQMMQIADSTVALFRANRVDVRSDLANLLGRPYTSVAQGPLCTDEPFYNQLSGAFCSGSLVGPDLILTAGHCIRSASACANTRFVFGFALRAPTDKADSVASSEVYECREIVARAEIPTTPGTPLAGADYAIVRLSRPVLNHLPLALNRTNHIDVGTPLVMLGHPVGIPLKVASGARVLDNSHDGYLTVNTDSYHGNSGSAVVNASTGLIEGILVNGQDDFALDANNRCMRSAVCPDEGCHGDNHEIVAEGVTRASAFMQFIPEATSH